MFTGIIQAQGKIGDIVELSGDKRIFIEAPDLDLQGAQLGDSIAVCGVCLTVVEFDGQGFWMDVSLETINCTTLKSLQVGSRINLEKSLTPTTALGGHLVTGHVDGVGEVTSVATEARSTRFIIRAPGELGKYIAAKGSICVDGTSLTVNSVDGSSFDVNIIPHTLEHTLFGTYQKGTEVNLEVDIIARYVERMTSFAQ